MKVNVELLAVLTELYRSVPYRTPQRINIIYEFAKTIWDGMLEKQDFCKKRCIIDMHDENEYSADSDFEMTIESLVIVQ